MEKKQACWYHGGLSWKLLWRQNLESSGQPSEFPWLRRCPFRELGRDIFVNLCRLFNQQTPMLLKGTCTMAGYVLKGGTVRWQPQWSKNLGTSHFLWTLGSLYSPLKAVGVNTMTDTDQLLLYLGGWGLRSGNNLIWKISWTIPALHVMGQFILGAYGDGYCL